jgi:MerR family transcriptional regulator, light-induced transcriptional regulator
MTDNAGWEQGPPPAASLTVSALARRLGVAPATLRTWDRRYGLGPSQHTAGAHRRYAPEDVARLGVMRRLTVQGVTPAEAARVALASHLPTHGRADPLPATEPTATTPLRAGGSRAVTPHDGAPAARGLARAAMALDSQLSAEIIRSSLDERGVVETWERLLRPVLVGVGDRWDSTGQCVDVEHLLSETIIGSMRIISMSLHEARNPRPVLLACAEEEQHSLPLYALAAALAERRVEARVLGARVPRDALASAVRRSGPVVVFIFSQLADTGSVEQLRDLPRLRPAPAVLVGGPGWVTTDLPDAILATPSLPDALERIEATATS